MLVRFVHWIFGCVSFSLIGADCGRVLTEIKRFVFSPTTCRLNADIQIKEMRAKMPSDAV